MNSLCGCSLTISQGCVVFTMKSYTHKNEFISLGPGLLTHKVIAEAKGAVNLPLCALGLSWASASPFLPWCPRSTWRTSETMVAVSLVHVSILGSCSCFAEMVTCFASWRLSQPVTRSDMCFKSICV